MRGKISVVLALALGISVTCGREPEQLDVEHPFESATLRHYGSLYLVTSPEVRVAELVNLAVFRHLEPKMTEIEVMNALSRAPVLMKDMPRVGDTAFRFETSMGTIEVLKQAVESGNVAYRYSLRATREGWLVSEVLTQDAMAAIVDLHERANFHSVTLREKRGAPLARLELDGERVRFLYWLNPTNGGA